MSAVMRPNLIERIESLILGSARSRQLLMFPNLIERIESGSRAQARLESQPARIS